eukprot:3205167-Prorocentrum_lima.AAC.1
MDFDQTRVDEYLDAAKMHIYRGKAAGWLTVASSCRVSSPAQRLCPEQIFAVWRSVPRGGGTARGGGS